MPPNMAGSHGEFQGRQDGSSVPVVVKPVVVGPVVVGPVVVDVVVGPVVVGPVVVGPVVVVVVVVHIVGEGHWILPVTGWMQTSSMAFPMASVTTVIPLVGVLLIIGSPSGPKARST